MPIERLKTIEAAAMRCLESCEPSNLPLTTVSQFIETLKTDPAWTEHDIIEMQTRVISVLLSGRRGDYRENSHS